MKSEASQSLSVTSSLSPYSPCLRGIEGTKITFSVCTRPKGSLESLCLIGADTFQFSFHLPSTCQFLFIFTLISDIMKLTKVYSRLRFTRIYSSIVTFSCYNLSLHRHGHGRILQMVFPIRQVTERRKLS